MTQKRMQIGELAETAKVSPRTIYYYEQRGLIQPAVRKGTGYRYYDEQSLKRLHIIIVLKKLGLSLKEIGKVIDLYFDDPTGVKGKRQVVAILEKHLAEVERRVVELQRLRDDIIANIARIKAYIEIFKND